ncbi:hypothetical protein AVEN_210487-1 [Araneus ventricosus]|uniref:Uncharacterized protein n=1 Tax=Araneus ventricosus TaxID=182803 RepID=A0A4Y2V115_ARAVE|nr:hypothetical protein AVEN_210487-1 [Araneus ventricosus]
MKEKSREVYPYDNWVYEEGNKRKHTNGLGRTTTLFSAPSPPSSRRSLFRNSDESPSLSPETGNGSCYYKWGICKAADIVRMIEIVPFYRGGGQRAFVFFHTPSDMSDSLPFLAHVLGFLASGG